MFDSLIYDSVRTPRGKIRDSKLQSISPVQLAATPLRALKERNDFDVSSVEDVVLGCVLPVGEQGGDIPRSAALLAGYSEKVPGLQINRFCSSGLDAVNLSSAMIKSGQNELVIAGGVESMSRVSMGADRGSWVSDPLLTFPEHYVSQGFAADMIASLLGHDRSRVDSFAAESHKRATVARENGHFERSIVPVNDLNGVSVLSQDDNIRPNSNTDALGKLRAAFAPANGAIDFTERAFAAHPELASISHIHTAGNSSAIVDGAAAILMGSAAAGKKHGLTARARIKACSSTGVETTTMLTGPISATELVLEKAGMTIADIDLFEINEAFASVALMCIDHFDLDPDKVNVNGGAIAMGHPLGASGAILLSTALEELERRDLNTALVTLCVAGGMGVATIIERV
ncbi:acetyl-CoA C-acetyltransferase [Granulosicoccus antarcticus]|uniref:Acyltransferase n=1 Tax=Granulosicoccus antarcticus IMCC3135 TaxID=1192854 RepID=A0A2Z2NUQ1_9GAMM|nr:acetyl-CoA C-acetyltransferase [Granulosicoccus antarcticus]ASJ73458.1 Putative acyltransferase [Granulosicoccus antarcticus IMCC3135]